MTSWFRKLIGGSKPEPVIATREESAPGDQPVEMERFIGRLVAAGYETPQQILVSVSDYMGDELDAPTITLEAGPMLQRALQAHALAEKTWPAVTDYDRLRAAFAALEDRGITARENFSCCGTCGSTEIWDEMDDARNGGATVTGYAFFHMQDTERAADGDGLYLNYGAVEEGEAAALGGAATIVSELERHGLAVDWDGSWGKRIGVTLDWKRRREQIDTGPSTTLH
jgi:hypothetical protein